MEKVTFKDLALPLASRGIPVIPCQPLSKATYLGGGEDRGTTDPDKILAWDAENPEYNVGCLGTLNGVTIFDCDEPGLVARIQKETGQKMPKTFAVKAINGGGHLYFKQTDASRRVVNKAGEGVFELRGNNLYVVGPGSKALDDKGVMGQYRVACDAPIADFPEWLEPWILQNSSSKKGAATGETDADSYRRLRKAYQTNLNAEDMFGLTDLTIESLHPTLHSLACLLHDGHRTEDEVGDLLERLAGEYGHREARGRHEIDGIVAHAFKKAPCEFTLEEGHPALESFTDGLKVFATEGELKEHLKERLYRQYVTVAEPRVTVAGELRYPTEVWDDTEYAEFARRGTAGNYIPPEFFIESLKTYVGAIAGNNMLITNERSGRARFYTILLAGPGTGKNTAIDSTHEMFRVDDSGVVAGDWPAESLIWYPQHKIETRLHKRIGACRMKMSSASGLARSLPRLGKDGKVCNSPQERLIVVYTELAEMFEKLGIEGSGAAMMSALCDLYDGEEFVVPALADNDSFGGRLMMSILAGIQPRKWDIVCAGKGIEGSGFDERINLIPTTNTRTVASLDDPDWTGFKEPFLERLLSLEAVPYAVQATREAKAFANDEYQKLKPKSEDEEAPSAGRLNVLAWRNALHYSWLTSKAVVDVDAVGRGMKLAQYQLEVRRQYKPLSGDNATARAANAIQRFMEKYSIGDDIKFRDLEKAVHANRLGPVFDSGLTHLASRGRIMQHEQKRTTPTGERVTRYVRRLD